MKKIWLLSMSLIVCLLMIAGCGQNSSKSEHSDASKENTLTISAAASLTDVTKALEKEFKKSHPDTKIDFNYGGSGALRQQIEKGAPVDVFMSANTKDVDTLKSKDKVIETYDYAHNKLVLIKQKGQPTKTLNQLSKEDHLALGEVESVPAGKYAKTYLEKEGLWKQVQPQIVYTKDVREVLNYVDKGNATYGFVYETDLYAGNTQKSGVEKVKAVKLNQPITYRMGRISDNKASEAWSKFMKSDKAKAILKDYHFEQ